MSKHAAMSLQDFVVHVAERSSNTMDAAGRMPAGHNGPYGDRDTAVRNTGHWLIVFATLARWLDSEYFRERAMRAAQFLLSKEARPFQKSFYHRIDSSQDTCNGLVGQAWTIEALCCAAKVLNDERYSHVAAQVFLMHPFKERCGLWGRMGHEGTHVGLDATFNHQLWFAAAGALLSETDHPEVKNRVRRFMDCLPKNLTVLSQGLVYHPVEHLLDSEIKKRFAWTRLLKRKVRALLKRGEGDASGDMPESLFRRRLREKQIYKSVGYHAFNMYGFGLLKQNEPDHPFWTSPEYKKAAEYLLSDAYREELHGNRYGYPYNPPGFEVPAAAYMLNLVDDTVVASLAERWVNRQLAACYDHGANRFSRNNPDEITLSARIYEVLQLPPLLLKSITIHLG